MRMSLYDIDAALTWLSFFHRLRMGERPVDQSSRSNLEPAATDLLRILSCEITCGVGGGYRVDTQSFVAHCNNKYDCHSNARRTIQNFTQGKSFIQALSLIQCAMLL